MHQNLKFNYLPKNSAFQPIVAAQAHGTFFAIFMKIHNWNPGNRNHECEFYLQNFRGAITIGFYDLDVNVKHIVDDGQRTFQMELSIEPFNSTRGIPLKQIDFEEKFLLGDTLDVQFKLKQPSSTVYNPNDLDNSLYIDPYRYYRDGECYTPVVFDSANDVCSEDFDKNDFVQILRRPNGICDMTISKIHI